MSQDYDASFVNCQCRLCGQKIINRRSLGNHLARSHGEWNLQRYVLELCLQGNVPECRCGCGREVEWHKTRYRYNDYVSGHNNAFSKSNQPKITEEQVQKRNESIRRAYERRKEDIASKISNSLIVTFEEPSHRKRMSEHVINLWSKEEFRSKVSEGQKRAWQSDYDERYTKVFTAEMRRKVSESNRKRNAKHCSGLELRAVESLRSSLPVDLIESFWISDSESSKCYDAFVPEWNVLIELDGVFWHGLDRNSNFSISQIANLANDRCKERVAANNEHAIVRIAMDETSVNDFSSIDNLQKLIDASYHYQDEAGNVIKDGRFRFDNDEHPLIERKEILKWSTDGNLDKKFLNEAANIVTRFFKEYFEYESWFHPDCSQSLDDVLFSIASKSESFNGEFNMNPKIGNAFLKSRFPSYWHADNGPAVSCKDEKKLSKVIRYRMGLNNSKLYDYKLADGTPVKSTETFDITPRQIRNGFVVQRRTVSWFPPVAASQIWNWVLRDCSSSSPRVWDPSAGFGARMLAFASIFPQGTYVATEPASMTFGDLERLAGELEESSRFEGSIELFKQGSERIDLEPNSLDAVFTSPPYFDREKYFNEPEQCWNRYPKLASWIDGYLIPTFRIAFNALKPGHRMAINVSSNLSEVTIEAATACGFVESNHASISNKRDAYARKRKKSSSLKEPVLSFVKPIDSNLI